MTNDQHLESTSCPLCNSDERANAYNKFLPYKVVRCEACGFYYLSPRLTEATMMQMYENDGYYEGEEVGYASYAEQESALRATFRHLMLNLSKRGLAGGALLEVGCGFGYLLEEAKDFFETRVGTDFCHQAVEEASKRADAVYVGGVQQLPVDGKFDCIIANQVIEHVYQPKAFLEQLSKHLKPGGKIVMATPNMGSFWRKLMGHRWPSFKIPEHILYFDKKSLTIVMKKVGLVNINSLPYPHAFPLTLIFAKLRISLPKAFAKFSLWLPATTVATYGFSLDE